MANIYLSNEQLYNLWKLLNTVMFLGADSEDPTLNELGSISIDLLPTINKGIIKIQRSLENDKN